ncbi:hypothetical protein A1351_21515 [Methylosinus sp. R-45379]|nr:hypothetical protein A1351_21515 [Methylosinus sp. R-45379]
MPTVEHLEPLRSLAPSTIIDVGANKGQFSVAARHLFPNATIHAFEPLESERRGYRSVVAEPYKLHHQALGAVKGKAPFFVASRADSSSLLVPGKNQEVAYGVSRAKTIEVEVERLAEILDPQDLVEPVLLKLDVQGAELEVLEGAETILPAVDAVYCEMSFIELYQRQPTANKVISILDRYDFVLRGVFNISRTKPFGQTQADFLFVKETKQIT